VAARLGIAGVGVVIHLVRTKQHVGGFETNAAAKMPDRALSFLGDGLDVNVLGVGGTRAERPDFEVGIGAGGILGDGCG